MRIGIECGLQLKVMITLPGQLQPIGNGRGSGHFDHFQQRAVWILVENQQATGTLVGVDHFEGRHFEQADGILGLIEQSHIALELGNEGQVLNCHILLRNIE